MIRKSSHKLSDREGESPAESFPQESVAKTTWECPLKFQSKREPVQPLSAEEWTVDMAVNLGGTTVIPSHHWGGIFYIYEYLEGSCYACIH